MISGMGLVLGLMAATVVLVGVGERVNRPFPVLVLLVGAILAVVPGVPKLRIQPSLILPLFLPPLIFALAQRTSWRALWDRRRAVLTLALMLVIATVAAVAVTAEEIVPGISAAGAIALGALASPPDPVAVESVAGPVGMPRRLVALLQAEGLCNDATALVVYGLATDFIAGGHEAPWEAVPKFLYQAVAGPLAGLAVAWASRWLLRSFITAADARSGLTLIVPFACYLLASVIHASGVLAVVAAGLHLGRSGDDDAGVSDRLNGGAFWNTAELLVTGVAFGLIGLELRDVLEAPTGVGTTLWNAAAICGVVLAVRFAWMMTTGPLVRGLRPLRPGQRTEASRNWREDLVLSWCGMRGLATIALALALPLSTPVRGPLLAIAFGVIVATLVMPGLTLPWLLSWLRVSADAEAEEEAVRAISRRAGKAALRRLRELDTADDLPANVSEVLRRRVQALGVALDGSADAFAAPSDDAGEAAAGYRKRLAHRAAEVKQVELVFAELLTAARAEVLTARTEPGTDPVAADEVLRQLDLRSAHLI